MAVLVSDTSVVVDLERGRLLERAFRLPFDFAVPDLLYRRELAGPVGERLVELGLRVEELSPDEVGAAARLARVEASLSGPDTFAYALARSRGWLLLTGDAGLRRVATAERLEVHGLLWLVDRIEEFAAADAVVLHTALTAISQHPRCRLPRIEMTRRLNRYSAGLG
jgi:hypothetical protein